MYIDMCGKNLNDMWTSSKSVRIKVGVEDRTRSTSIKHEYYKNCFDIKILARVLNLDY